MPPDEARPPELKLSLSQLQKIQTQVRGFLPSGYDHEFISDTIIVQAWLKGFSFVTQNFVRCKCINAWRERRRELRRNEAASRVHRPQLSTNTDLNPVLVADRKARVEEAVGCLGPYERKLIWMRYYDDQTLVEVAESVGSTREEVQKTLQAALYKMRIHLT